MPEKMSIDEANAILQSAGIFNPLRLVTTIHKTIDFLDLDLSGLTILTEAATGPYSVTPVIAAMSGAEKVIAITNNSRYGSISSVKKQTQALEKLCRCRKVIEIVSKKNEEIFGEADIVTNLGFVRPIDTTVVGYMKPEAVVPLMCEAWEVRNTDVDIVSCMRKGISVAGTNENFKGLEIFIYSGWLCLKMLLEAHVNIQKCQCLVISDDKFGRTITDRLLSCGVKVKLYPHLRDMKVQKMIVDSDALIIADYKREDFIIGNNGDIEPEQIKKIAPGITILQFSGRVAAQKLKKLGIAIYPGTEIDGKRMARTLSDLGPYPVVELHAAGLKVGQLLFKKKYDGFFKELVQQIN